MNREQAMKLAEAVRDMMQDHIRSVPLHWFKNSSIDSAKKSNEALAYSLMRNADLETIVDAHMAQAGQQEPVAWMTLRGGDPTFPRVHAFEWDADYLVKNCNVGSPITKHQLYTAPPAVAAPSEGGLHLDKGEVEFLAARVRRLCNKFNYHEPEKDDRFIVSIAGSLIGSILTNLELAERNKKSAMAVPDGWREFIEDVAQQCPETPDYWSSCGQCERNISRAEDLLAAAPKPEGGDA